MSLLDLFRKSRLKVNTPNGTKPAPYQDESVRLRNVKFPPNLSPGALFENYVRYEGGGGITPSPEPEPVPPVVTQYLVTENNNFLMTENNNNLIA